MLFVPRNTEKAYAQLSQNTYVFAVPANLTKVNIANLIAQQFQVTVKSVRINNRKGKAMRYSRGRRAYPGTTYRQDIKYAFVTLAAGDKINIFEEETTQTNAQPVEAVASVPAQPEPTAEVKGEA